MCQVSFTCIVLIPYRSLSWESKFVLNSDFGFHSEVVTCRFWLDLRGQIFKRLGMLCVCMQIVKVITLVCAWNIKPDSLSSSVWITWLPAVPKGFFFSLLQNGELIYGCKDDQDCVSDWNELARHLKPFFFPSNGLVSGPHCTRTIVKELIHVITTALLSSTDTCRAGDMKTVPISQGRSYCEASAFNKELVRNGKGWYYKNHP